MMSHNLQSFHDTFIASMLLVLDTVRNTQTKFVKITENASKMISAFDDPTLMDIDKQSAIIKKVSSVLSANITMLANKDKNIFLLDEKKNGKTVRITLVPAIDIGCLWDDIKQPEQEKIWVYLKSLYVSSVSMFEIINETVTEDEHKTEFTKELAQAQNIMEQFWLVYPNSKLIIKNDFNPYVGVGQDTEDYTIDKLLSGPELLSDQCAPGLEGMGKMLGLEKLINLDELAKNLKNIDREKLDDATNKIKEMLGDLGDVDGDTTGMIDSMLNSIKDEIGTKDLSKGSPTENIFSIAKSVATKIKPQLNSKQFNKQNAMKTTTKIIENLKKNMNGKIPDGSPDPFAMLTKLMSTLDKGSGQSQNKSKKNSDSKDKDKDKELEELMKECSEMGKKLGIKDIDIEKVMKTPVEKL